METLHEMLHHVRCSTQSNPSEVIKSCAHCCSFESSSTSHLRACAKLQLPFVLVLFAPLELTSLECLAANNDLEASMLIRSARNTLQLALCDRCLAAKPAGLNGGKEAKQEAQRGSHRRNCLVEVSQKNTG